MRFMPVGDRALLVELPSLDVTLALYALAGENRHPAVVEMIPAARTILVRYLVKAQEASENKKTSGPDHGLDIGASIQEWLTGFAPQLADSSLHHEKSPGPLVEIPVHYQGEDLDRLAQTLGMSRAELIRRHTGTEFQAAFSGFAPGFVYLTGGDPCFSSVSRLDRPRVRVPAGSVAVAGGFSAVYPSDSPGGWQLLGITSCRMWDPGRSRPALIEPGCRVRFRDIGARACDAATGGVLSAFRSANTGTPAAGSGQDNCAEGKSLRVLSSGMQTLVQDLGRPGLAAIGVTESGALDRAAMLLANSMLGNPPGAAVLENALGGLQLQCRGRVIVAVTGAEVPVSVVTPGGVRVPAQSNHPLVLDDGNILRIGQARAGMRVYVAVQGGFDISPVLGSRATDILSGLGPAPLRKGDLLPVGDNGTEQEALARASASLLGQRLCARGTRSGAASRLCRPGDLYVAGVIPGPRDDWFGPAGLARLFGQEWLVTSQSNRVGMRLSGKRGLQRSNNAELPSEAAVAGSIQVPANGQPVVFLADHPVTGGYPVIAVVRKAYLDGLAQLPPGARLRFRQEPEPSNG